MFCSHVTVVQNSRTSKAIRSPEFLPAQITGWLVTFGCCKNIVQWTDLVLDWTSLRDSSKFYSLNQSEMGLNHPLFERWMWMQKYKSNPTWFNPIDSWTICRNPHELLIEVGCKWVQCKVSNSWLHIPGKYVFSVLHTCVLWRHSDTSPRYGMTYCNFVRLSG
jgi:hypothetical protein